MLAIYVNSSGDWVFYMEIPIFLSIMARFFTPPTFWRKFNLREKIKFIDFVKKIQEN